eukprot:COSAG05_NODE_1179_length_5607_cov_13.007711_2_plen_392_part_00
MSSSQEISRFLCKHTDKSQLDRLIAELVCAMNVSDPDASNEALHALCADLIYKDRMAIAAQDFVTGPDPWPQISTTAHKYGSVLNKHTLDNRNHCIKAIHKQLKTTRPLYENGYMHWLNNLQAVTAATKRAYPRSKSTFRMAAQSICQLCEAVSQPELKQQYYEAYQTMMEKMASPKREQRAMSPERVTLVRAAIETLRLKAVESGYVMGLCNDYLQLAWLYGDSDAWQPQRNDCVTFRFDGPDCDKRIDNYIALSDGACILTINTAKKITLQAPVIIQVHETSPQLAAFLRAYQPIAAEYQQSNAPYTLCTSRDRKAMSTSHLTTRAPVVWKKLGLNFTAHGCIVARNTAVAAMNTQHGKRKLSEDELQSEQAKAKMRLHSRSAADTHYG